MIRLAETDADIARYFDVMQQRMCRHFEREP